MKRNSFVRTNDDPPDIPDTPALPDVPDTPPLPDPPDTPVPGSEE